MTSAITAARGVRGRRGRRPGAAGAVDAPAGRLAGQAARARARPPAAPRAGDRRAVARGRRWTRPGPRLHKAAHYARRALGGDAVLVVLRNDMVALLPDGDVRDRRRRVPRAWRRQALADGYGRARRQRALDAYAGPLLPDDLYEPWADEAREAVRAAAPRPAPHAGRWEELLEEDPADEAAHLALIRRAADRGDVARRLRQFERMDQALRRELGTDAERRRPSELRARLWTRGAGRVRTDPPQRRPAGRSPRRRRPDPRRALDASRGRARRHAAALRTAGVGKSAVLDLAEALARSAAGGPAAARPPRSRGRGRTRRCSRRFGDLCRQHPALLDGLDDVYRLEIERALSGRRRQLDAASRPPAAVRGGRRADAAGRDGARAAAGRRRPARGRRGVAAAAALPVPLRGDRAGADRRGPPARLARDRQRGGREPGRAGARATRIELAAARPARRPGGCSPTGSRTCRPETVEQIWRRVAGCRSRLLELAAQPGGGGPDRCCRVRCPVGAGETLPAGGAARLDVHHRRAARRSPALDEDAPTRSSRPRSPALVVEPAEAGYRFRHALVRERAGRHDAARTPARPRGARSPSGSPSWARRRPGWPTCSSQRACTSRAVPYALRAVETAGALGAYRDALTLIDAVRRRTPRRPSRPRLLARRGDLLHGARRPGGGGGLPEAVAVTTGTEHRLVRARLARAAAFAGELRHRREPRSPGSRPRATPRTAPILLARGNLAYFTGDIGDGLGDRRTRAARSPSSPDDPWQLDRPGRAAGADRAPARRVVRALPDGAAAHAGQAAARHGAVRRAPVRGGVPALRPGPLRRGDRGGRGAARQRRAGGRAARGRVRDAP